MPEIDEDRKIQMITKLLEKGGTMLANHHECGAPMFRYQGIVVCPVCDFQEHQEKKQEKKQELRIESDIKRFPEFPLKKEGVADYSQMSALIKNKLQALATSLENEADLQRVKDKMECIELGIRILKLLDV